MAEARARDTLQPALLERLTDHDPTRTTEGREDRVLTRSQLRAAVLRDLTWLFNTTNLLAGDAAKKYPLVAESTVNYGLDRVRFLGFPDATPRPFVVAQHTRIVDALEAHDGDEAAATMFKHLNEIVPSMPHLAAIHPDLFEPSR